jgi:hypothetical protein
VVSQNHSHTIANATKINALNFLIINGNGHLAWNKLTNRKGLAVNLIVYIPTKTWFLNFHLLLVFVVIVVRWRFVLSVSLFLWS